MHRLPSVSPRSVRLNPGAANASPLAISIPNHGLTGIALDQPRSRRVRPLPEAPYDAVPRTARFVGRAPSAKSTWLHDSPDGTFEDRFGLVDGTDRRYPPSPFNEPAPSTLGPVEPVAKVTSNSGLSGVSAA